MASNERKIQAYMTREQTAEYLRSLAKALEGEVGEAMVPDLEGFKKFKLTMTPEGERFSLKCSVKHPKADEAGASADEDESESGQAGGRLKYGKLKKRMKADFKTVLEAGRQGVLPDADVMSAFIQDCELMITYPDKGDPYYEVFAKATGDLSKAFDEGDIDGFASLCEKMDLLKRECHDRYK